MNKLKSATTNQIDCLEVKIRPWGNSSFFDYSNKEIKTDDWILVNTEHGEEIGKVIGISKIDEKNLPENFKTVKKIAGLEDLKKLQKQKEDRKETLKVCKQFIRKYDLPMKLVDCCFTFDDKKIIFAFTADTRVDFRQLVRDLTGHFKKGIRLQQIGIRDEVKQIKALGPCGRETCCACFLEDLGNITTDLARVQQIHQRGSERLSGACGRLKCCLNYEAEGYRDYSKILPAIGSKIKTDQGEGKVMEWNVIKHSVLVRIDRETVVEKFFGCKKSNCSGCKADKYLKEQKQ